MALQLQLENGSLIGGGGTAFKGANVHAKPLDYGSFGHYRGTIAVTLVAGQASTSRLLELRNNASNWIIPTKVEVTVMPFGAVAVPYVLYIGMARCTSFSAVDTTNVVTPALSPLKSTMPASPGGAQVRHVTAAGHSAGMTGGTLTKDGGYLSLFPAWIASVSATMQPLTRDLVASARHDMHPLICASNEGFVVENVNTGSATANNVVVLIDLAWAEVPVGGF